MTRETCWEHTLAEIPPLRNLPQEAEPWGRWVEGELRSAQSAQSQASEAARNGNSAIGGTFNQIAAQIEELSKRRVYAASSSGGSFYGSTTLNIPLFVPLSFTLAEGRNVFVQATTEVSLFGSGATGSTSASISVDGTPFDGLIIKTGTDSLANTNNTSMVWRGPVTISFVQEFPAGSYDLNASGGIVVTGTGGGASILQSALSAQILDRA